jgi:alkaline phosphatase D
MLGDTQRQWWQDQMKNATTTWKLWGNEVSLLRMQVDGLQAVIQMITNAIVATDPGNLTPLRNTKILPAVTTDIQALVVQGSLPAAFAAVHALFDPVYGKPTVDASVAALNAQLPPVAFLTKFLLDADQWDGYNAERKTLMSFLQTNGVQNVVALTGDIHAFFAGTVMADFDAATPQPVMVDLVTAGISSTSLFQFYVDFLNSSPTFASLSPLVHQGGANNLDGTIQSSNSWIKYADTDAQGYAVVTLTPTQLSCTFKKVKKFVGGDAPSPAVGSTKTAVVTAGTAGVVMQ